MENNIERKLLPLALVDVNDGQIEGLPRNPRSWTYADVENLKASLEQTPELLEARGIIVYPYEGRFVAIGGNLRLTALRSLEKESAPCIILPADMPIEKLKEIAIKDNGSFGSWDEKLLLEDWNGVPFAEWGIDLFFDNGEDEEPDKRPKDDDGRDEFKVEFEAREFDFVNQRLREINEEDQGQALLQLIHEDIDGKEAEA